MDPQGLKVYKVFKEREGFKEKLVLPDRKETVVFKVIEETVDPKERGECKVNEVTLDLRESRDLLELIQRQKMLLFYLPMMNYSVMMLPISWQMNMQMKSVENKESRGFKESKVIRVIKVILDPQEPRVTKEIKDLKESKVIRETKEIKDPQEPRETKETKESKEIKDFKESKEIKEIKDLKESKETKEIKDLKG